MKHAPRVPNERGFLRHPTRQLTCVVLLAVLLARCGGASSARDTTHAASAAALHRGELTDFVPAAGLRWLVSGSPAELAREPALALLRQRWLTPQRLRAFATLTGIDLLGTERGLVAGFDLGTLYMVDASGWVAPPERLFAERLAGSERLHQTHPRVWRVTGLVGSEPEALVRVDDDLVAVAVGDPTLARVVELFAEGRLARVATAFEGASLSALPAEVLRPRTLAFYVLGPLDQAWIQSGSGLLASAHALAVTLDLVGTRLDVRLFVPGRWDPNEDGARLGQAWRAFAGTSLGQRLALDRPLAPPEVRGSEGLLSFYTSVDGSAFSAGLEALLVGNLDDLLGLIDASSGAPGDALATLGLCVPAVPPSGSP
jgi:hypothetical protein